MEQIKVEEGLQGPEPAKAAQIDEDQVMESAPDAPDNLKIVRQDTTDVDCAISPKQGSNRKPRTFASANAASGQVRIKADTTSHSSKSDVKKPHK